MAAQRCEKELKEGEKCKQLLDLNCFGVPMDIFPILLQNLKKKNC